MQTNDTFETDALPHKSTSLYIETYLHMLTDKLMNSTFMIITTIKVVKG